MKRFIFTTVLMVAFLANAKAIGYSTARSEALFLTDKMAYELGLTDDQYSAAYEINLDYIMNVATFNDLLGIYWTRRNTDMSYVLTPAQYQIFIATEYFYRPMSWYNNRIHYVIYDRYPRHRYFRSAPPVYFTYKGGNRKYNNSPYKGRDFTKDRNGKQLPVNRGTAIQINRGGHGSAPRVNDNNRNGNRNDNRNSSKNGSRNYNQNQNVNVNVNVNDNNQHVNNNRYNQGGSNRQDIGNNKSQGTNMNNRSQSTNRPSAGQGNNRPSTNNNNSSVRPTTSSRSSGNIQRSSSQPTLKKSEAVRQSRQLYGGRR